MNDSSAMASTTPESSEDTPHRAAVAAESPPVRQAGSRIRQRPSFAAWTIMAINVLVWLAMLPFGGSTDPLVLVRFGAKINVLIVRGQIWRLVTPIFLHIGLVHLAFNTYALYIFGPQLERFFGTARFLCIYMLSGIYGVLFSFAFSPHAAAGASGAIFGLIGTQAVFFHRYRNAFGARGRRQFYNLLVVIGYNLVYTFTASNIDVWGHLGGLVAGAALGWGLMPRYAVTVTERGPRVLDQNHPGHWGPWVLAATIALAIGAWAAIAVQGARF